MAAEERTAASKARPSRRTIFGFLAMGATAATIPAAPAQAVSDPTGWRRLSKDMGWLHPQGQATAAHAEAAGLNPAHIYALILTGEDAPSLCFRNPDTGQIFSVNAKGVR